MAPILSTRKITPDRLKPSGERSELEVGSLVLVTQVKVSNLFKSNTFNTSQNHYRLNHAACRK